MPEHSASTTQGFNGYHRASCTCGWVALCAWRDKQQAENDAHHHQTRMERLYPEDTHAR